MTNKIIIQKIQALASIQDLGRYGFRQLGIGHAGAMDTWALRAGNILVNNPENTPAIEIALGAMTVVFQADCVFAITGALYEGDLDGMPIHSYWRYFAKRGQVLHLNRAVYGVYAYLCVAGGWVVETVLDSDSTDIKAQFGGHEGRYLRAGDELLFDETVLPKTRLGIAPIRFSKYIHAVISSEYDYFNQKSQFHFWQNEWVLQSDSNRMGYRFSGQVLALNEPLEMLSHAVQFGTVQVPPSGQLIVLMADCQTTGGYPKMATVIQADLGRLAQTRFGSKIQFVAVSLAQAQALRQHNEIYLNKIKNIVSNKM